MFGFDSKDCFLVFPIFFVSKPKNTLSFCFFAYILSTKISKTQKLKICFGFGDFSMQKTKPKTLKNQNNTLTFFFLRCWLIISIQKKTKAQFFIFFPFQNQQKPRENKNNLLSQNHTFSQQFCFLWFCSSSLFFLVCLLFHMIAICVLMLAYLTGQSFSLKSLRTM